MADPGDGPTFDERLTLDLHQRRTIRRRPAAAAGPRPAPVAPRELPDELPRRPRGAPPSPRPRVEEASGEVVPPASDAPAFASADAGSEPAPPAETVVADAAPVDRRAYRPIEIEVGGQRTTIGTGSVGIDGDHVVHQHVEPDRDGRRGAAGTERRRARAARRPDRQDLAGARLDGRDGYLTARRADAPSRPRVRDRRLRLHDVHRQLRPVGRGDGRARARRTASSWRPCCPATETPGRGPSPDRAAILASPPLVVAFALAGRVDIDLTTQPLGTGSDGRPVFLADIWPSPDEIRSVIADSIDADLFRRTYAVVFEGDERWRALSIPEGQRYLGRGLDLRGEAAVPRPRGRRSPGADGHHRRAGPRRPGRLGDDRPHLPRRLRISPASPAGQWLQAHGVGPLEFNSYGARRGQHEVMARGTFANIRLRNGLVAPKEGPYTVHLPSGEEGFIYDTAMRYVDDGVPLLVIAGREYGSGSSRDWAAKGPLLLGVKAVIAESYQRIHHSNLVGMGVSPLQFKPGDSTASLGLTGRETYSILGLAGGLSPRQGVTVVAVADAAAGGDGRERRFEAIARLDGPIDVDVFNGGGSCRPSSDGWRRSRSDGAYALRRLRRFAVGASTWSR